MEPAGLNHPLSFLNKAPAGDVDDPSVKDELGPSCSYHESKAKSNAATRQQRRHVLPASVFPAFHKPLEAEGDHRGLHHGALKSGGHCCLSNGPQEEEAISKLASPTSSGLLVRAFIPPLTTLVRNMR